ncbi:CLUMA_CG003145, isoform A [Clunio marinus]|uniref:CLUMA_CG003145, isoform A n=1 Tax=Clunio marinus TaxID=568069 RepID=A0A1J1HMV9_9DIPT|nr:CLUMA_CG003145, isoform A [Clunio marinus]
MHSINVQSHKYASMKRLTKNNDAFKMVVVIKDALKMKQNQASKCCFVIKKVEKKKKKTRSLILLPSENVTMQ